jgi:hypothetical protein
MLDAFRKLEFDDRDALRAQLDVVEIGDEDEDPSGGFFDLFVPDEAPRMDVRFGMFDGQHTDADGALVGYILWAHAGKLTTLERYRLGGGSLIDRQHDARRMMYVGVPPKIPVGGSLSWDAPNGVYTVTPPRTLPSGE